MHLLIHPNYFQSSVLIIKMWLWDRGQPLDSIPPDELCSRKTVLRRLFGLLNGKDFRQFGEAMLYCSNWKGSDHTLGCEKENGCKAGRDPCFVAQVNGFIFFTSVKSL